MRKTFCSKIVWFIAACTIIILGLVYLVRETSMEGFATPSKPKSKGPATTQAPGGKAGVKNAVNKARSK